MRRNYQIIQENCQGVVKWFNIERGYGFVVPTEDDVQATVEPMNDGSLDVFFHVSSLTGAGKPQTNDRIEFDLAFAPERGKVVALNIAIVEFTNAGTN